MADFSGKNRMEPAEKVVRAGEKLDNSEVAWWQPAVVLFIRLSAWIAGPVVVGTFLGKYLDQKFKTEPIMLISVVGFSFLISMVGLVKESAKEFKKIEEMEKGKKEEVEKTAHNMEHITHNKN